MVVNEFLKIGQGCDSCFGAWSVRVLNLRRVGESEVVIEPVQKGRVEVFRYIVRTVVLKVCVEAVVEVLDAWRLIFEV